MFAPYYFSFSPLIHKTEKTPKKKKKTRGHSMALPFTLKSILRQKKKN
jgi:hypothetical protein